MQIISNDKTERSNTVKILTDCNSQCSETQAKKGEQLVPTMAAFKKAFGLMRVDVVNLTTEKESVKTKTDSYDER